MDQNGNLRMPDGCLFFSAEAFKELSADEQREVLAQWREACAEYRRV